MELLAALLYVAGLPIAATVLKNMSKPPNWINNALFDVVVIFIWPVIGLAAIISGICLALSAPLRK